MTPKIFNNTICRVLFRQMVFLFLLLAFSPLKGQQIYYDQISNAEGLAQSTIFTVIQDGDGVYWMGNRVGIARYDGETLVNFSESDGIARDQVRAICPGPAGQLWFGHKGGGITRFNGQSFDSINTLAIINKAIITSIVMDAENQLWFATAGSGVLRLLNPEAPMADLEFVQYSGKDISDLVYSFHLDREGKLYFITDIGIKIYNKEDDTFENVVIKGLNTFNQNTSMLVDSRNRTWVGQYYGGVYCYDPITDTTIMYDMVKLGLGSNFISCLYEDREGSIWVGTYSNGVAKLGSNAKILLFNQSTGFSGREIWSISQDREGNILIGSNANGLLIYKGHYFVNYTIPVAGEDAKVSALLHSSDKSIWMGTNQGISILRHYKGDMRIYELENIGDEVLCLDEDTDGTVWIGTKNKGVYSYNDAHRLRSIKDINGVLPVFGDLMLLNTLAVDKDDILWIGHTAGLRAYDIQRDSILRKESWRSQLDDKAISLVFVDSDNRKWIGSERLGIFEIQDGQILEKNYGADYTPTSMVEDKDGFLWVGTLLKGVLKIDPNAGKVIDTLNIADGLLSSLVNQLNVDRFNNVYIGTNRGLSVYYPKLGSVFSYTGSSGFVGIETRLRASCTDQSGDLWFGTSKGATSYRPSSKPWASSDLHTEIIGLEINDEHWIMEDGMKLSHRENSLVFNYRTITLDDDQLLYRHKLDGLNDPGWSQPDKNTRAIYPALPPGIYTFRVTARNRSGQWSEEVAAYHFTILAPFLLRWYSILVIVILLLVAVISFIRIRERNLKRENILLEEKVRHRTALVVSQKEELSQKNKDITDSIHYASRIQMAILPEQLPYDDSFILFKPKDIVSGDFYWFTEVDGIEYFTASDCTGHGVPGAFMSIIGHNSLTRIVRELGILRPNEILGELNRQVIATLQHRSEFGDVYDGMDLALVAYDPKKNQLEYSGAFNPLYLVRDGELHEYKADKRAIGHSTFNLVTEFSNHLIDIKKGDMIYMFSDGYADQFGGPLGKKFKYKSLKEIFLSIQDQPVESQRTALNDAIETWRGDHEQVDDILIIGRRF